MFSWLTGSCCSAAPREDPVPWYRRPPGGAEGASQAVCRPDLCHRVHQYGGHWDTSPPCWEWHSVCTFFHTLWQKVFSVYTFQALLILSCLHKKLDQIKHVKMPALTVLCFFQLWWNAGLYSYCFPGVNGSWDCVLGPHLSLFHQTGTCIKRTNHETQTLRDF